jgi:hypothetical protein
MEVIAAAGRNLTRLSREQTGRGKKQQKGGADPGSNCCEPSLVFAAHAVEHLANSFELAIDLARRVGGYEAQRRS